MNIVLHCLPLLAKLSRHLLLQGISCFSVTYDEVMQKYKSGQIGSLAAVSRYLKDQLNMDVSPSTLSRRLRGIVSTDVQFIYLPFRSLLTKKSREMDSAKDYLRQSL